MELAVIEEIEDFSGYKKYAKAHAVSDWRRHEEIMSVLKPISDAFRTASGVRKVFMAVVLALSVIFGSIWSAVQIFGGRH